LAGFQPFSQPVSPFDDDDDIDDWMLGRNAQVAGRDAAEAAGRTAWNDGARSGEYVDAPQPGDLVRLGTQALSAGAAANDDGASSGPDESTPSLPGPDALAERAEPIEPDGTLTPPRFGFATARPGISMSNEVATGGPVVGQDHHDSLSRRQPASAPSASPQARTIPADSVAARNAARWEGYRSGLIPGVGRAGLHAVEGFGDSIKTGLRLSMPMVDKALSRPGQSAFDQLAAVGAHLGLGIDEAVLNPIEAWRKTQAFGRKVNSELNPLATPLPPTAAEARRAGKNVAMNDAELATNVLAAPIGGEAGATLEGMRYASDAGDVAKYLRAGHPLDVATHLAKRYVQPGHHAWAKSRMLPDFLGGGPLPPWLSNSRLNMLRPRGIDIGQFLDLHSRVDPKFFGTKLPGRGRGEGWSAKRLGIPKYDELGQTWHGIPGFTKGLAAGVALDIGDDIHSLFARSQSQ
jgi:hypothetical protein